MASGRFVALVPITNIDAGGVERADMHALTIRLKSPAPAGDELHHHQDCSSNPLVFGVDEASLGGKPRPRTLDPSRSASSIALTQTSGLLAVCQSLEVFKTCNGRV